MEILILGGTRFLGRALVDACIGQGDRVTIVHRGKSMPEGISGAESLVFDRAEGHAPLAGRRWDAAIDTSGQLHRIVGDAARTLAGSVDRYCFVSSISVYQDSNEKIDEWSPTVEIPPDLPAEMTMETYGAQKVMCERAVEQVFGERAFVVRPGLIVGPHDVSDRFTYWVRRIGEASDREAVLAPGNPERAIQFIDVRDLAEWMVRAVRDGASGTFNATGPERPVTMRATLESCARVASTSPRFVWLSDAEMAAAGLEPWMQVPLWIPEGEDGLVSKVDIGRALAAGLRFRPLDETVRATLEWDRARPQDAPMRAGIARDREREVLAARV